MKGSRGFLQHEDRDKGRTGVAGGHVWWAQRVRGHKGGGTKGLLGVCLNSGLEAIKNRGF